MTDTPKVHPSIEQIAKLLRQAGDSVRGHTLSETEKKFLDDTVVNVKAFFDAVRVVPDKKEESEAPNSRAVRLNEKSRTYIYTAGAAGVRVNGPYTLEVTSSGAHILRVEGGAETILQPGWIALQVEPNA